MEVIFLSQLSEFTTSANLMRTKPCSDCPFIQKGTIRKYLGKHRRLEIANSLLGDSDFSCHKTNNLNDDGQAIVNARPKRCVGAAMWLDNIAPGGKLANVMFRLAVYGEELPKDLPTDPKVCQSYKAFVED